MNWKQRDRELETRSRGWYLPEVRPVPGMPHLEIVLVTNGKGKEPTSYVRQKLTLREIARGRRATLPWRKVS